MFEMQAKFSTEKKMQNNNGLNALKLTYRINKTFILVCRIITDLTEGRSKAVNYIKLYPVNCGGYV
jgi:hypothetical protein